MGYLNNSTRTLDAILTRKGREMLARGQMINISKFALGDDEVDYALWDTSHQSGTDYYGAVIENLPFLEPFDDPDTIMKYKLVTRTNGTKAMATLASLKEAGSTSIGLNYYADYLITGQGTNLQHFDENDAAGSFKQLYYTKPEAVGVQTLSHDTSGAAGSALDNFNGELYSLTILDSSVAFLFRDTTPASGTKPYYMIGGTQANSATELGAESLFEVQNVTQTINDVSISSGIFNKGGNGIMVYGHQLTNAQSPAKTKLIVTGQQSGAVLEFNITVTYNPVYFG